MLTVPFTSSTWATVNARRTELLTGVAADGGTGVAALRPDVRSGEVRWDGRGY